MAAQVIEEAFRLENRELTAQEQQRIKRIKQKAKELATEFYPTDGREKATALTRLEECVMWAVKGITK